MAGVELGRLLILWGLILVGVGVVLVLAPKLFAWFGHLPGDIRIERDNVRVYIPVTSMLVVSLLLTVGLNLIAWLMRWWGGKV
ncbi:hypothetical protein Marky_1790 [Marinithermus hydrothermalis DSM 14884]|uniref:DUF2905 domain-containing protein n=1 Tax=Marinithermus hydrothermalis (strain DSM 14884 / JCM 11576 / T1) TaxID=869210 RepID=F2NPM2_MARHT|nr:hypothetical protein Marky_1790 [Marinithermus hydrothermalis DSM 14884]